MTLRIYDRWRISHCWHYVEDITLTESLQNLYVLTIKIISVA